MARPCKTWPGAPALSSRVALTGGETSSSFHRRFSSTASENIAMKAELPILHFAGAAAFAAWLADNPTASGAWVKLAQKGARAPALTQAEAIDCALCHGWIDGQIGRFDDEFFLTRFTPRAAKSRWSAANRKRAQELIAAGRVTPQGPRRDRGGEGRRPLGRGLSLRPRRRRRRKIFKSPSRRTGVRRRLLTLSTAPIVMRCSTGSITPQPAAGRR